MAEEWLLAQWFERWVDEQPDHVALTGDDGGSYTYAELEVAANRIANAIDDGDPGRAHPVVAIALDQSTEAILGILGASKSGRTVVPLDVAAPPLRVAQTLAQLEPALVLTTRADEAALTDVPPTRWRALRLDELPPDADASRRARPIDLDGTEVVQFTSGSTGVPKGVPRSNRAAAAVFVRRQKWDRLGPGQRVALTSDFQWAAGWGTIRDSLCTGTSLHRYSTRRRGATELGPWLREERITSWGTIPSLVQAMLDASPGLRLPDLRSLRFSGDLLYRSMVEQLWEVLPEGAIIGNRYGASETGGVTDWEITRHTVLDSEVVPVGAALSGVDIEIADPDGEGVGEIVVTSFRGSTGYLGADPDDPRISDAGKGRTTYRTGDQGRFRPDGLLELRGRKDHMVKVRGHRVDLTEIEVAMRDLPQVEAAAAGLLRPPSGLPRVVAWLVPVPGGDVSVPTLRLQLRKRLPGYMIPSAFVALEGLPRTTRGKLDRAALPDPPPGRPDLGHPYEAPVGDVERMVTLAFARVLDVEPVGRHDAFFDLGGDSLHAAEVMTLVSADLGRDLPLSVFVDAETPAELAARFDSDDDAAVASDRLVTLQPDGAGPPLYCVHGGGGQVLSFAALATRLGTERPFIGVQMRAGDRARSLFSVRRLAARYAQEILARGGRERCAVAGHSYGRRVRDPGQRRARSPGPARPRPARHGPRRQR